MLLFFGCLLAMPLILNGLAVRDDYKRFVDAVAISAMLCAIWAFTSIIAHIYPFPQSKQFHPLIDLIGLSFVVLAYMTQQQPWKLALAFLFLAQLVTHLWFWDAWFNSPSSGIGRDYILVLNLLWLGQLVCVGVPGGMHLADIARGWMRPDGGLPHPARN